MLRLYRRHAGDCRHRAKGQYYTNCFCPIWAVGEINGRPFRQSLKLRDWSQAVRRIESIEREPHKAHIQDKTVDAAVEAYLEDCRARRLAESTIVRYGKNLDPLRRFCAEQRVESVRWIDLELLTAYRGGRKIASSTQGTELECLRAFCGFCQDRGWMDGNPAKVLKSPLSDSAPTLPFSADEVSLLLAACDRIENNYGESAARARVRARALLLLLLYSGLRISDAGQLERSRLTEDGRLFLRLMKTRNAAYVKLPRFVIDALNSLPRESEQYIFWSGNGKLSSLLGSLRRTVYCLGKLAGIDARPHRFRDTFAVRLLEQDVPIRTVQILLGHTSVKTTERHYAPFMRSHQRMLDDAVALLDFQAVPEPVVLGATHQTRTQEPEP